MELSITRSKAALIVVGAAAFGWWHLTGGRAPDVPPELREVLPSSPTPASPSAPAPRSPVKNETPASPASPEGSAAPGDAPSEGEGPPKKPERTPDEKARSKVGVAESYAENGRYDRAFEVLEEAEALGPTDAVRAEIAAARERITTLMRAKR